MISKSALRLLPGLVLQAALFSLAACTLPLSPPPPPAPLSAPDAATVKLPPAPIRTLATDSTSQYLRLQAVQTGVSNAADDGRNTFAAFAAPVPQDLVAYDQEGRQLRTASAGNVLAIAGVHKGVLLRLAAGGNSYLAPNPRAGAEPLSALTGDPDLAEARSRLEGEGSQMPAFQRALDKVASRSAPKEVAAPALPPPAPAPVANDPTFERQANGVLMRVFFASGGKAIVRPDDGLARLEAEARKATQIRIAGFTDNIGSATTNSLLAQQRAEAIRQQLVARGIAPERILVSWNGAAAFLAENTTTQGRAMNRRVEIQLTQPATASR